MHPWLVVVVVVVGSSLGKDPRSGSLANGKEILGNHLLLTPFVGTWGIQVLPAGDREKLEKPSSELARMEVRALSPPSMLGLG